MVTCFAKFEIFLKKKALASFFKIFMCTMAMDCHYNIDYARLSFNLPICLDYRNSGSTVIRDAKGTHWKKKEAIGSRVNVKEAFGNKRKSKETEKNLNRIVIYFLFKETRNKEMRFEFWRL